MVDDDDYMAKVIQSILEIFEVASVRITKTNDDAMTILNNQQIDCVFVDNMTCRKTGFDLARLIRKSEQDLIRKIPIILCTAYTGIQSILEARDAGVTEILAKPVSPDQIMKKLDNALFNQRDFINCQVYTGPDRRRRIRDFMGDRDRRQK